jgi:phosphoribosylformylglycinamidine cyclo-ligase
VRGMAHITGGGLPGNVARIVPEGLTAAIDTARWTVPAMFGYVAEVGHISIRECYRAFNMGVGYVVVTTPGDVERVLEIVPDAFVIGEIRERAGDERVELLGLGAGIE